MKAEERKEMEMDVMERLLKGVENGKVFKGVLYHPPKNDYILVVSLAYNGQVWWFDRGGKCRGIIDHPNLVSYEEISQKEELDFFGENRPKVLVRLKSHYGNLKPRKFHADLLTGEVSYRMALRATRHTAGDYFDNLVIDEDRRRAWVPSVGSPTVFVK